MKNLKDRLAQYGYWFPLNKLHFKELKKRIKKNEGFSAKPYKDQLGHLTIGYGHLILPYETHLTVKKNSKVQLKEIFIQDFNRAVSDYKKFIKINKKFYRPNDKFYLVADFRKARKILNWKPKVKLKDWLNEF